MNRILKYFFFLILLKGSTAFAQGSGKALAFDGGNDNVVIDGAFPDMGNSDFSITAWVMTTDQNEAGQRIWCDDKDNLNGGYALSLGDPGSGRLRFYTRGISPISLDVPNGSVYELNSNEWTHVAAVHDASTKTKKIYVNGVLVANSNYSGTLQNAAGPAAIGGEPEGSSESGNRFKGRIDEVSFWSKPLSGSEVRDLMCEQQTGKESGLLGYWNFDNAWEGAGGISDRTGHGYNGTMKGMSPSDIVTSGASLGKTAVHAYPGSWSEQEVTLASPEGDSITVSQVGNNPAGIHVYYVAEHPDETSGTNGLGENDHYFGVFKTEKGGSYTVTYHYTHNAAYQTSAPSLDENDLRLYKRADHADNSWEDCNGTVNTNNKTITATGMNTEYILGKAGTSPLPVEWLDFRVESVDGKAELHWMTASETNCDRFIIQKSRKGQDPSSIGSVPGAGTTSQRSSYTFTDPEPYPGVSYYRIEQVDHDGKTHFSAIIPFERSNTREKIQLHTTKGELVLHIPATTAVKSLQVFDVNGRIVHERSLVGQKGTLLFTPEGLRSNGVYLFRVRTDATVITRKLFWQMP